MLSCHRSYKNISNYAEKIHFLQSSLQNPLFQALWACLGCIKKILNESYEKNVPSVKSSSSSKYLLRQLKPRSLELGTIPFKKDDVQKVKHKKSEGMK